MYDQVHLGTGGYSYGNAMVGLYAVWHNAPVFQDISADFGIVVSNDGLRFREPEKGVVYLAAKDSPAEAVPGKSYNTILCQGNGILNVGDETRIYHGRWRNCCDGGVSDNVIREDYDACVALATIPRDRWAGLMLHKRPGRKTHDNGSAWTCPIMLPDGDWHLTLNADGVAGLRVEVSDEHFNLMLQFSGENSGTAQGKDGFDVPVKWAKGNPVELNGKTVRFRICFKRSPGVEPMLYAAYLEAGR
jgi:hypothetical protein